MFGKRKWNGFEVYDDEKSEASKFVGGESKAWENTKKFGKSSISVGKSIGEGIGSFLGSAYANSQRNKKKKDKW